MSMTKTMSVFLLGVALMLAGCESESVGEARAADTLNKAGYTNVAITGWRWIGCGRDDIFQYGFTATGPSGVRTSGVVCRGLMKGSTVRLD